MTSLPPEQAALRARQGLGARYDAPEAPVDNLLHARRGTAYFARILNDLPDDALANNSARPGLSRAHVIAHIGYHARALARLMAWARTGMPEPHATPLSTEITRAASLPPRALRGLFQHSAIHLDAEWRDLPGPNWDAALTHDSTRITARAVPLIRARAIWQAALDLDAGGRPQDMPASLRAAGLERAGPAA